MVVGTGRALAEAATINVKATCPSTGVQGDEKTE